MKIFTYFLGTVSTVFTSLILRAFWVVITGEIMPAYMYFFIAVVVISFAWYISLLPKIINDGKDIVIEGDAVLNVKGKVQDNR